MTRARLEEAPFWPGWLAASKVAGRGGDIDDEYFAARATP